MPRKHGGGIRAEALDRGRDRSDEIPFRILDDGGQTIVFNRSDKDPRLLSVGARRLRNAFSVRSSETTDLDLATSFTAYRPLFLNAPVGDHDLNLLGQLGSLIAQAPDDAGSHASTVPAAYTYLGQFLAHEVSRMEIWEAPQGVYNFRTPALDLDSIFGTLDVSAEVSAASVETIGSLALGQTDPMRSQLYYRDLPRSPVGEAQIADARNDQNLGAAHVSIMVTNFYRRMLARHPGNAAQARLDTIRHFQHVVIHDYLAKLVDPATHAHVLDHGPLIVGTSPFLVPNEFALACFRVGHSMVRGLYRRWSSGNANIDNLLENTYRKGCDNLFEVWNGTEFEHRLAANWPINWRSFVPLSNDTEPNFTNSIGSFVQAKMGRLESYLFDEIYQDDGTKTLPTPVGPNCEMNEVVNLAQQTLLRGKALGLPDAQTLHGLIASVVAIDPMLTDQQLLAVPTQELKDFLDGGPGSIFLNSTPLWFYCLRESHAAPASGNRFGPITGRVVMETLFAAILSEPQGILGSDFAAEPFTPHADLLNANGKFGLTEFVRHAVYGAP